MIEITAPDILFNKQKVFQIHHSVTNTITNINIRKAVIVYDMPTEVLPSATKEMLDKLTQACQFKPEETVYLNAHFTDDISLGEIQNQYKPTAVLVFGDVSISRNLSKLKRNYAYEFSGTKVLNAESLDTLVKNDAAKKALWLVLKKMLGL